MNQPVAINKLSAQLGLTSRTLRHWESEGLLTSIRDQDSGWRVYDEEAILCIKITAILRKLDLPLKDIKIILEARSTGIAQSVIRKQLLSIRRETEDLAKRKKLLTGLLKSLEQTGAYQEGCSLIELGNFFQNLLPDNQYVNMEDSIMNNEVPDKNLRFISLPPMRAVYNIAISTNPEDAAMTPVIEWLKKENLMGTAKLYGGDVEPWPSKDRPEYGYGFCASIPENADIPSHLKEIRLPGGLYAMLPSSEDIYNSWQLLVKLLSQNKDYEADR